MNLDDMIKPDLKDFWRSPFNSDDIAQMLDELAARPLKLFVPADKKQVVTVIPTDSHLKQIVVPVLSHIVYVLWAGYLIDNRAYVRPYSARELGPVAYRLVEVLLNTEKRRTINPLHLVINMAEGKQYFSVERNRF